MHRCPLTDHVELKPLAAYLEAVAPRAAADADLAVVCPAEYQGELPGQTRVTMQR